MHRFLALILAATAAAAAAAAADEIEVDLELLLMVDVSRSMSPYELEIQRQGYAAALESDAVYTAVQSGMLQRIALGYVEWAGTQEIVVDWRLVETRDDLQAFADALTSRYDLAFRRTSISGALDFGAAYIGANTFRGLRRVIDVSGDGPNNQGRPVTDARDQVLAQGIVVNGLPLMTNEGDDNQWHLDGLDIYYEACVIGGPGSFMIPVLDWEDFAEAVRRKLVLEIASAPISAVPVQVAVRDPRDCLVGEKMWEQRRLYWGEP